MNIHPITTPASPFLASPHFDAKFASIESFTTSFATSVVPTLETTTVTEVALGYHRNQQYSITAMTASTGAVAERYAYTAYGQPTIRNASGSPISNQQSQIANRFTYTGREWDETLGLHHFRALWMSPLAGRFLGRDPIGYEGSPKGLYKFLRGMPLSELDPTGLIDFGCDQKFHDCNEDAEDLLQACLDAGWGKLCYPGYYGNLNACITLDLASRAAEAANDVARFCLIYQGRCVLVGGVFVIGGAVSALGEEE